MKSAKVQKATLDPLKISGRCGRLMCCLRYEGPDLRPVESDCPKLQDARPRRTAGSGARLADPHAARAGAARRSAGVRGTGGSALEDLTHEDGRPLVAQGESGDRASHDDEEDEGDEEIAGEVEKPQAPPRDRAHRPVLWRGPIADRRGRSKGAPGQRLCRRWLPGTSGPSGARRAQASVPPVPRPARAAWSVPAPRHPGRSGPGPRARAGRAPSARTGLTPRRSPLPADRPRRRSALGATIAGPLTGVPVETGDARCTRGPMRDRAGQGEPRNRPGRRAPPAHPARRLRTRSLAARAMFRSRGPAPRDPARIRRSTPVPSDDDDDGPDDETQGPRNPRCARRRRRTGFRRSRSVDAADDGVAAVGGGDAGRGGGGGGGGGGDAGAGPGT